ncbi:MAG: AAA family ATPase [Candidatus Hydrothermales bacterium]
MHGTIEIVQCKRCNVNLKNSYNFCTNCGQKLKDTRPTKIPFILRKKYIISLFVTLKWKVKIDLNLVYKFTNFLYEVERLARSYDAFLEKFNFHEGGLFIFGHNEFERDLVFKVLNFSFKIENLIKSELSEMCDYGIGISSGWSFFGEVEPGEGMSLTALGDCVNTAQRLSTNLGNKKYVSFDIYEASLEFFEFEYLGNIRLKGKTEKMEIYTLISGSKMYEPGIFDVPFVERKDAKELFDKFLKDLESGKSRSVILTGEAGVGKTFFLDNYVKNLKEKNFIIKLRGCEVYTDEPFYPLKTFLVNSMSKEEFKFLKRYIEFFLDVLTSTSEEKDISERIKYLFLDFLRIITKKRGKLIIIFDDIDRADSFSIELINFIKNKLDSTFIILTARTLPVNLDLTNIYKIDLKPLNVDEVMELVSKYYPNVKFETIYKIATITGGIPLFIAQYLKSLKLKGKDLEGKEELPLSLMSFALSQVNELTIYEKDLLEILSLIVELDLDSPLSKHFSEKIEKSLVGLISKDILRIENNTIHFINPLLREVIYNSIPDTIKNKLHEEIVDTLKYTDWAENNPYFLFIQSLKAKKYDIAWEYSLKTLDKFLKEGTGFIPFFIFEKIEEVVLKNHKIRPLEMGEYLYLKGIYSYLSKDFEKAISNLHKALLLTDKNDSRWNEINFSLAKSYIEKGIFESARKFLQDVKVMNEVTLAKINLLYSEIAKREGKFFDALLYLKRSERDLLKKGYFNSEFKINLSDFLFWTGNFEDSLEASMEAEKSSFMEMNHENVMESEKIKCFLGLIFKNENLFKLSNKIGISFSQRFYNSFYSFYFNSIKTLYEGNKIETKYINLSYLKDPYIFFLLILGSEDESLINSFSITEIEDLTKNLVLQNLYIQSLKLVRKDKRLTFEELEKFLEMIFKYPIPFLHLIVIRKFIKIFKKIDSYEVIKYLFERYLNIFENIKSRIQKRENLLGFENNNLFNPSSLFS